LWFFADRSGVVFASWIRRTRNEEGHGSRVGFELFFACGYHPVVAGGVSGSKKYTPRVSGAAGRVYTGKLFPPFSKRKFLVFDFNIPPLALNNGLRGDAHRPGTRDSAKQKVKGQ
jgi:hypothetical protein